MGRRNSWIRPLSTGAYFVIACVILYFYADPYFCSSRVGQTRLLVSCKLAFGCSLWDFAAGSIAATVIRGMGRALPALFAGVIVAVGLASIPFWIYRGYGEFVFENTWADVSCFFTEGSAMAFPFVVAPALAIATLVREWIVGKRESGVQRLTS